MHFPTLALLHVILLSILGGPKTALASVYVDAFGKTNFGLKCSQITFSKPEIYAAAKNYCDNKKTHKQLFEEGKLVDTKIETVIPILLADGLNSNGSPLRNYKYRLIVYKESCYVKSGFAYNRKRKNIEFCTIINTPPKF